MRLRDVTLALVRMIVQKIYDPIYRTIGYRIGHILLGFEYVNHNGSVVRLYRHNNGQIMLKWCCMLSQFSAKSIHNRLTALTMTQNELDDLLGYMDELEKVEYING